MPKSKRAQKDPTVESFSAHIAEVLARVRREKSRRASPPLPRYTDHIVCFMDILGFRQTVERMTVTESRREIRKLSALLEKVIVPSPTDAQDPFRIRGNYFSDCVCLSCEVANNDLKWIVEKFFYFFLHVLHIQGELIFHDVVIRGAITVGKHYANNYLIFSKAQARAYDLESKHVVRPMVMVDESVFQAIDRAARRKQKRPYPFGKQGLESDLQDLRSLCATDEYGRTFVNYLGFWNELDSEHDIEPFFVKHKALIENQVKSCRGRMEIISKYEWLARYHNVYVERLFSGKDHLRVEQSTFGSIDVPSS
jgi:hypothetical protein